MLHFGLTYFYNASSRATITEVRRLFEVELTRHASSAHDVIGMPGATASYRGTGEYDQACPNLEPPDPLEPPDMTPRVKL